MKYGFMIDPHFLLIKRKESHDGPGGLKTQYPVCKRIPSFNAETACCFSAAFP